MSIYYLLMIDGYKFVVHKQSSLLQVTQQNIGGSISNIVAIFKANDSWKHYENMEDFNEDIKEIVFENYLFTEQGSYKEIINNFLTQNKKEI